MASSLFQQKTSLMRLENEMCGSSPLRVVSWYHCAYLHDVWIESCVIRRLCESFWFHNFLVKFQINAMPGENQRLKKVVLDALSVFSRVFHPPIHSAETSGPCRRHCHNTGRNGRWDTEKNGFHNHAHVQCHDLHEWRDAWVCECRRYFRSIFTLGIVKLVREKPLRRSGRNMFFLLCVHKRFTLSRQQRPCASCVFCNWDECHQLTISLSSQLWLSCPPSLVTSSNNLPKNSELEWAQDHEYFLNKLSFATWKSYGLFPSVQVSDLFFQLLPGSLRQFSCEYLQLSPDKSIHNSQKNWREPKHFKNNTILPRLLRERSFWSFDFCSQMRLPYDTPSFEERSRTSARNPVMPLCEDPSSLLRIGGIEKSKNSQRHCEWPKLKFNWLRLELSSQLFKSLHTTNCWRSCFLKHI